MWAWMGWIALALVVALVLRLVRAGTSGDTRRGGAGGNENDSMK
jgi:hypothetical protein